MKRILLLFLIVSLCVIIVESNTNVELFVDQTDEIDVSSCTIATFVNILDDTEVFGAISLARSLKHVKTKMDMHVIVYQSERSHVKSNFLKENGWKVFDTSNFLDKRDSTHEYEHFDFPTKEKLSQFAVYMLVDYDIVIYLENDVVVSDNIDELCRCKHAKLGGVPYVKKHNVGAMTLVPSKETFKTITETHDTRHLNVPYDFFEYFYKMQDCPFYDPLLEKHKTLAPRDCIRLPARYNGDIVYQILYGWIDNQIDPAKILHYSMSLMKPWSWWSSILLPQYWIWSSNYLDALRDAEVMLGSSVILWYLATFFVLLVFYFFPFTKKLLSNSILGFLYQNPTRYSLLKLNIFHLINYFFIIFAAQYSDIYLTHPIMNILLFTLTLGGLSDILLFNHLPPSNKLYAKTIYVVSSFVFFSLFLNSWLISIDFLTRINIIALWFVWNHVIFFTYLFLSIRRHQYSLSSRLPQLNNESSQSSNDKNPLLDLIEGIPNPREMLTQWSHPIPK